MRFARRDPITGLIAFPDFHRRFPKLLGRELARDRPVLLAVGDVDNLKDYVEGSKRDDPSLFGHLAGNALMADLGRLSCRWLAGVPAKPAVLSTFGGDEIILAMAVGDRDQGPLLLQDLRDELCSGLPRTVSFAYRICTKADLRPEEDTYLEALVAVDRALFKAKADHEEHAGFVIEAKAAEGGTPCRIGLLGGELAIILRGSRDDELIRGRRYRVGLMGHEFVAVAHEAEGQASLAVPSELQRLLAPGTATYLQLTALADRGALHVPAELDSELRERGIDLEQLPEGERRQLVKFVREGREPAVRRQRIDAVIGALAARR